MLNCSSTCSGILSQTLSVISWHSSSSTVRCIGRHCSVSTCWQTSSSTSRQTTPLDSSSQAGSISAAGAHFFSVTSSQTSSWTVLKIQMADSLNYSWKQQQTVVAKLLQVLPRSWIWSTLLVKGPVFLPDFPYRDRVQITLTLIKSQEKACF